MSDFIQQLTFAQGASQGSPAQGSAGHPDVPLRSVLDALPTGVLIFDVDHRILYANAMATGGLKTPDQPSEQLIEHMRELFQLIDAHTELPIPDDQTPLAHALRGDPAVPKEFLARRAHSARYFWLLISAQPVRDLAGAVTAAVLTFEDIGVRKRRELDLDEAEKLHSILYKENLTGVLRVTFDGRILDCNSAIIRMLGYKSRRSLLATRASRLYYDPADRERFLRQLTGARHLSEFEVCLRRQDGSACWVLLNARLLNAPPGEVGGSIVSNVVDITRRRNQEETLRHSEQRFAAFMRHMPGVAFIKDLAGKYVYYNEASWIWFRKRPKDLIGRTDEEIWPGEDSINSRRNDASVIAAEHASEFIETVVHPDGKHSWLMYKFPIVEDDKVTLVGGVGIDVTERSMLEEQLTEARKMEALGRLAGGVAHDFNNLLTVIAGYGQLAIESVDTAPAERITTYLREILDSSRRASALTGQLLALSRRQVLQLKVLNLGELLSGMERLLQRVIGEHVELTVKLSCRDCLIFADPNQMEQAIMNLAVNARDAMPLGGQLELQCDRLAEPIVQQDGKPFEILLEVRDTGVGMEQTVQAHIFDPFYTSKEKGRGTGLGLSTVHGAVSQAKGKIEVESIPGEGTVFRLYFPSAEPAPGGAATPARTARAGRGRETVLVVEDEASLRALAEIILKQLGYKVLVADSGAEALRIWAEHSGAIDILLSDVIMPHMSGGELAHQLRAIDPHLPVLFMSGYTDDMIASHGALAGDTQLIQKPFTAEALGREIRAVLDA